MVAESAELLGGTPPAYRLAFREPLPDAVEPGDMIENRRMPEVEIKNCRIRGTGGFRISTGRRVRIENCRFETAFFSVLFSVDMNYWYENGPVKDVAVTDCEFDRCGVCLQTECGFQPTETAPYYHENVRFVRNEIRDPLWAVLRLERVRGLVYAENRVTGAREGRQMLELKDCADVALE